MRDKLLAHLPALRRYAHSLTGQAADAEDLLHDCLEKAISRAGTWRGGDLRAWLFTIMTNLGRDARRRARVRPVAAELDLAEHGAAETPSGDPLAKKQLLRALDAIAPDSRAILMLVVIEGHTYAEVASILDVPIGTVMSRLSRTRRQLAKILSGDNILPMSNNGTASK